MYRRLSARFAQFKCNHIQRASLIPIPPRSHLYIVWYNGEENLLKNPMQRWKTSTNKIICHYQLLQKVFKWGISKMLLYLCECMCVGVGRGHIEFSSLALQPSPCIMCISISISSAHARWLWGNDIGSDNDSHPLIPVFPHIHTDSLHIIFSINLYYINCVA